MASNPGYTGVNNSQLVRENFVYENERGRLGSTSTLMLNGPGPINGTRVTLSAYIHNTNVSQVRTFTLRMTLKDDSDDNVSSDFFYRALQPKEVFILPLIIVKGTERLKGFADVTDEVNFNISYKEEI